MPLQLLKPTAIIHFLWNIPLIVIVVLALLSLSDILDSCISEDKIEIYHLRTRSAICIVIMPVIEAALAIVAGIWYTQHGFLYETVSICTLPILGMYSLIGAPIGLHELRQLHKTKNIITDGE